MWTHVTETWMHAGTVKQGSDGLIPIATSILVSSGLCWTFVGVSPGLSWSFGLLWWLQNMDPWNWNLNACWESQLGTVKQGIRWADAFCYYHLLVWCVLVYCWCLPWSVLIFRTHNVDPSNWNLNACWAGTVKQGIRWAHAYCQISSPLFYHQYPATWAMAAQKGGQCIVAT